MAASARLRINGEDVWVYGESVEDLTERIRALR